MFKKKKVVDPKKSQDHLSHSKESSSKSSSKPTENPFKKYKVPFIVKRAKPIVPRRLVFLFGACLFIIVLYGVISMTMHQKSLYSHITDPAQQLQNKQIISYLDAPVYSSNNLDFLTPDEKSHMGDVKHRLDFLFIAYLVSLGLMIGIVIVFFVKKMWNHFDDMLARSLRGCGWTILAVCFVLGMAALIGFEKFWLLLHAVIFPSGNWMFASDSILITLYPETFFVSFISRALITFLTTGVVFLLLAWFMLKMRAHDEHFSERTTAGKKE